MATCESFESTRRSVDYSSDSSVPSCAYGHHVKRIDRTRCWRGLSSQCHTSCESLDSMYHQCQKQNLGQLAVMQSTLKRSAKLSPRSFNRRAIRYIWVTEVRSGISFYAMTKRDKEKADELKVIMAAQLGDSPTMAENVVSRMVCALKVCGIWERVMVTYHCTASQCALRTNVEEQPSHVEYYHVFLMEVGSRMCVGLSQLALVTRTVASETRKTRLYYLRRIYTKDDKSDEEAMAFLKSKIMNDQMLTAEVFYHSQDRGFTMAEIVMDNTFLSDTMVAAGLARYWRWNKFDQRERLSDSASCRSVKDKQPVSYKGSPRVAQSPPPRMLKLDFMNNTMPELMNFIGHLMKQRKESVNITSSESALNLAIKSHYRDKFLQHQGLCQHGYGSLHKYQILLRRLRDENPHMHEIRDINESLYDKLIGMFEKWKISYKNAQKKSDIAINEIGRIFINFTSNIGLVEYKHHCKTLEASLGNEVLLQNDGQELAQMIVPAVATKLRFSIGKLELSARGLIHAADRPHSLHHFITRNQNISPLALETLDKDKCVAEVEERSFDQPSETETGECTSELDVSCQPYFMEASGNETTDSETNSKIPSLASTEKEVEETQLPTTSEEALSLVNEERDDEETPSSSTAAAQYSQESTEMRSKESPPSTTPEESSNSKPFSV